jgi:TatD DNase family protein
MILHDAHNHLQDQRLSLHLDAALAELQTMPFGRAVVNGTRESDWDAVLEMAAERPWITPSLGLHPWYVPDAAPGWQTRLEALLKSHPRCCIGEIGLDRWIQGHDLDKQRAAFSAQLELAHRYTRPATIHCVRAWGALWDVLRDTPLPHPGILLHAYGGPTEMITGFVDRGAYFSFSPYFLHERKKSQRENFRQIPIERVLAETDAPDMAPPPERNEHPLGDEAGGLINHPANIQLTYSALAELRGIKLASLADQIDANFGRLFGP